MNWIREFETPNSRCVELLAHRRTTWSAGEERGVVKNPNCRMGDRDGFLLSGNIRDRAV